MMGSAWAVAGGTVAAAAGLAGLARRDLPEARMAARHRRA